MKIRTGPLLRAGCGASPASGLAGLASMSAPRSPWSPTPSRRCCRSRSAASRAEVDDAVDAAIDHDGDIPGDRRRHADILLDHEHGHVAILAEAYQHLLDLGDDDRRQSFGRLIHDQQMRIGQKRARDREHLLFAAGELTAAMVLAFAKAGEGLVDALDGPWTAPHPGREFEMLVDAERAPQPPALRDVADTEARDPGRAQSGRFLAADANRTAACRHQAHDGLAQGGLAHAVAADHREHAAWQRDVDALQRMRMSVIDIEALHLERGCGAARFTHGRLRDKAPAPRDRTRFRGAGLP